MSSAPVYRSAYFRNAGGDEPAQVVRLEALEASVMLKATSADLSALEATVATKANTADLSAVEGRASSLEGTVAGHATEIGANEARLAVCEVGLIAVEGRASSLEGTVAGHATEIGANEARLAVCEVADEAQSEALTLAFGANGAIAIETAPGVPFVYSGSLQGL